jgi:hypothetical protein
MNAYENLLKLTVTTHRAGSRAIPGFAQAPDGTPVDGQGLPLLIAPSGAAVDEAGVPVAADALGNPVPIDSNGVPVDGNGKPIPGAYVQDGVVLGPDGTPIVTDASGQPITGAEVNDRGGIILPGGAVLPKTLSGEPLGQQNGQIIDGNGNLIPNVTADQDGKVTDTQGNALLLDAAGNPIFVSPDGVPIDGQKNKIPGASVVNGTAVDHLQDPLVLDKDGKPLTVERQVRPLHLSH